MAKTRNFAEVIKRRLSQDAGLADRVERESFNAHVAEEIYNARKDADLTQAELADAIGTQQSVIARLESADYDGHSLTMLQRVAKALNRRVRVEFYSPCTLEPVHEETFPIEAARWKSAPAWNPQRESVRRAR